MTPLFSPLQLGAITVPNRIFMAPFALAAARMPSMCATALMAQYYAQRASGGLIIAEATMAIEGHSSFWTEPGIYSANQVVGWKQVTAAVHAAGGRIFLQIWHGGRACHPLLNNGAQPVASSPIAITGDEVHTPQGKQPYVLPRELRDDELPGSLADSEMLPRTPKLPALTVSRCMGRTAICWMNSCAMARTSVADLTRLCRKPRTADA